MRIEKGRELIDKLGHIAEQPVYATYNILDTVSANYRILMEDTMTEEQKQVAHTLLRLKLIEDNKHLINKQGTTKDF